MKRFIITALVLLLPFAPSFTQAAFIDRGGGLIYDDTLDVTWLQDANYAMSSGYDIDGMMSWQESMTWAATLSFAGFDDWRLPTYDNTNPRPPAATSDNEIGWLWYRLAGGDVIGNDTDISPFYNLAYQMGGSEWYWTGTENASDELRAWRISMNCACWDSPLKTNEYFAWAVRDGDVRPVPEPAVLSIFVLGLITIYLTKRRPGNSENSLPSDKSMH